MPGQALWGSYGQVPINKLPVRIPLTPASQSCPAQEDPRLTGFTVGPLPAVTTDALIGVDTIDASATIFTGVALAVINVCERKTKLVNKGQLMP